MSLSAARLSALAADADPWRGLPFEIEARQGYKEWQHFVVFGEGWTLLFNLSLEGGGAGKATTIVCQGEWQGHVAQCPRPDVRPGRLDATFDRAAMRWRGGRYEIRNQGDGPRMEVVLAPASVPSLSHDIRVGSGSHLSWCLVPRLLASGWVEIGGRRVSFEDRFAYHDHNWGRFRWGGDFSWEWGCAVPRDAAVPWMVVFSRMNDRARTRTTATSVFLLRGGDIVRYFRNAETRFTTEGIVEARPSGRVPAAAALLLPDQDRDVPRWTRFDACRGGESLSGEVEALVRGQILVPSETDVRGVVRLNEVDARARIRGICAGEAFEFEGPCLLEVVRG
ncbi:hypothetical protein WME90_22410 [Sorangium sp. So ce375]|uniref:hypothetical protein n=1 Tax=Sorangium sp. So ce375 TaxID=3133306 RepID=UPI003F5BDBDA